MKNQKTSSHPERGDWIPAGRVAGILSWVLFAFLANAVLDPHDDGQSLVFCLAPILLGWGFALFTGHQYYMRGKKSRKQNFDSWTNMIIALSGILAFLVLTSLD